jgi:transketolase C-terminal domain/subunit
MARAYLSTAVKISGGGLDADVSSSKSGLFGARLSERFFNVGISEQNMVGWRRPFTTGTIPL